VSEIQITVFPRDSIPRGKRLAMSWDALAQVICLDPPQPREVPKKELALWCPATFKGDYRSRKNVELVYALGFDVDVAPVPSKGALREALAGRACMYHLSSSATPRAPRWRLMLPLSRPVTANEYDRLWERVAKSFPFAVGQEARDPSRGWYMPRLPAEGEFVGEALS
jgi:putative DNA primase/helicase